MQTQNLVDSGILSKQQYFARLISSDAPIQHQPITHNNEKEQIAAYKKFIKNIQVQQKKKIIQKSQQLKKQLLEAQIYNKNYRHQIQRPSTQFNKKSRNNYKDNMTNKENKNLYELKNNFESQNNNEIRNNSRRKYQNESQKKITRNERCASSSDMIKTQSQSNKLKLQTPTILKGQPYVNKNQFMKKIPFTNTQNNLTKAPKQFTGIKLKQFSGIKLSKQIKLPQLNYDSVNNKKQYFGEYQPQKPTQLDKKIIIKHKQSSQKLKKQNINNKHNDNDSYLMNLVLRTYQTRYFGIDKVEKDYQKIGKSLLKQMMQKYWCYEQIENEQVYENFEDLLTKQINIKQTINK